MPGDEQDLVLTPWEPARELRHVSAQEVKLSRGFLCCEPQRWFPGFAAQWIPLGLSLGVELKLHGVKPHAHAPKGLEKGFAGTVDDEPIAMLLDAHSYKNLIAQLTPVAGIQAQNVLFQYLSRRLLTSLALSWSGPESSMVQFDDNLQAARVREAGAIQLELSINGTRFEVWILLGKFLVDRLDGLWKRQIRSTSNKDSGAQGAELSLEISQLAVPPAMLPEYMKPGAVIDLEVALSERVSLRSKGKIWNLAKLVEVEGKFGFEVIDDLVPAPRLPEGTTRMSIELGRIKLDSAHLQEISRPGALCATEIPTSSNVNLIINDEKVAAAELLIYEARYAMRVK